jgi:hypothetical protein
VRQTGARGALKQHRAEKFFAQQQFFSKNVLHNSNKCVQLLASDSGDRALQSATDRYQDFDLIVVRSASYRSYRGMVASFFHGDRRL